MTYSNYKLIKTFSHYFCVLIIELIVATTLHIILKVRSTYIKQGYKKELYAREDGIMVGVVVLLQVTDSK